jgi:hypothetical protein
MAKIKRRASGTATISKTAIEQVGLKLKDLPEKPKENLSLREAILELHDSITTALNRGYSYDEVVKHLATQGVSITVASLKRYLAAARKEVAEQPRRTRRTSTRTRKTQLEKQAEALSMAASPANPLNGSEAPAVASNGTAPQKRTRASSTRSKADAKSAAKSTATKATAAKTKTAAKAKPTSRAKTTSRSTSRSPSNRRKSGGASA